VIDVSHGWINQTSEFRMECFPDYGPFDHLSSHWIKSTGNPRPVPSLGVHRAVHAVGMERCSISACHRNCEILFIIAWESIIIGRDFLKNKHEKEKKKRPNEHRKQEQRLGCRIILNGWDENWNQERCVWLRLFSSYFAR
jgi:hypothetical protein